MVIDALQAQHDKFYQNKLFPLKSLLCHLITGVHNVLQRKHTLEGIELEVQPFYHFLENAVTNKEEIPFDAHLFEHIKRNHGHELQILTNENKVELFMDVNKSFLIISPSDKRKISQK